MASPAQNRTGEPSDVWLVGVLFRVCGDPLTSTFRGGFSQTVKLRVYQLAAVRQQELDPPSGQQEQLDPETQLAVDALIEAQKKEKPPIRGSSIVWKRKPARWNSRDVEVWVATDPAVYWIHAPELFRKSTAGRTRRTNTGVKLTPTGTGEGQQLSAVQAAAATATAAATAAAATAATAPTEAAGLSAAGATVARDVGSSQATAPAGPSHVGVGQKRCGELNDTYSDA